MASFSKEFDSVHVNGCIKLVLCFLLDLFIDLVHLSLIVMSDIGLLSAQSRLRDCMFNYRLPDTDYEAAIVLMEVEFSGHVSLFIHFSVADMQESTDFILYEDDHGEISPLLTILFRRFRRIRLRRIRLNRGLNCYVNL